jgi:hypothetical protein
MQAVAQQRGQALSPVNNAIPAIISQLLTLRALI